MTAEDRDKLRSLPRDAGGASFARVNRRASRRRRRAPDLCARAPIGRRRRGAFRVEFRASRSPRRRSTWKKNVFYA